MIEQEFAKPSALQVGRAGRSLQGLLSSMERTLVSGSRTAARVASSICHPLPQGPECEACGAGSDGSVEEGALVSTSRWCFVIGYRCLVCGYVGGRVAYALVGPY